MENSNVALSVFDDKSQEPRTEELEGMLGRTCTHWNHLQAHLAGEYAPLDAKWGWSLRLRQKKKLLPPQRQHV